MGEQHKRQFRTNIEELKAKLHETEINRDAVLDLRYQLYIKIKSFSQITTASSIFPKIQQIPIDQSKSLNLNISKVASICSLWCNQFMVEGKTRENC